MGKRNDNVIDVNSFDEVYIKSIDPSLLFANSPAERRYYLAGFNQAIELFHKYMAEEKISFGEAERRASIIMEVLVDESHGKRFGSRGKS